MPVPAPLPAKTRLPGDRLRRGRWFYRQIQNSLLMSTYERISGVFMMHFPDYKGGKGTLKSGKVLTISLPAVYPRILQLCDLQ